MNFLSHWLQGGLWSLGDCACPVQPLLETSSRTLYMENCVVLLCHERIVLLVLLSFLFYRSICFCFCSKGYRSDSVETVILFSTEVLTRTSRLSSSSRISISFSTFLLFSSAILPRLYRISFFLLRICFLFSIL